MQTELADFIRGTSHGDVAEEIIRKCVHCGFCNATCPTYQLLGNELDGPRGRIYLIKQLAEGAAPTERTQLHLDRCLTCRACETTCPSGVEYGRLLDVGRDLIEEKVPRKWHLKLARRLLTAVVPNHLVMAPGFWAGRLVRPLLPAVLKKKLPPKGAVGAWPRGQHAHRVVIHRGCVQRAAKPGINAAAARYLDRQAIAAVETKDGCCGALGLHMGDRKFFARHAKRNIDAWWAEIEKGAQAIVSTASGCGVTLKEYGELLKDDPQYREKAAQVAAMVKDISEIEDQSAPGESGESAKKVAFHSPCTLQHGQKITARVERILRHNGFELAQVRDSHLCCGSAGVYSLLQPKISGQLLENKVAALQAEQPQCIVTANIGCLMHLQAGASVPVKHWLEAVAPARQA